MDHFHYCSCGCVFYCETLTQCEFQPAAEMVCEECVDPTPAKEK